MQARQPKEYAMYAKDVMTSPVVSISPGTSVNDIKTLLRERHISGVPVIDADELIGIVSESDLLHRYELEQPAPPRAWWQRLVQGDAAPTEYVRSHGTHAADVMTRGAVSVAEDTPLAEVAALFSRRHIHRVPVLRGRRVVGIVTSSDLIQALAVPPPATGAPAGTRSDAEIRASLQAELAQQEWWNARWSQMTVEDGIVSFHGMIENEAARDAARVAAENTPGVRGVVDDRIIALDWQSIA